MNRHPHKIRILLKLEELLAKLGDEFDGHIDPREGYVLGNDMRDLKTRVNAIRERESRPDRNGLALVM